MLILKSQYIFSYAIFYSVFFICGIKCDRFCKLRGQEKCGASLKAGNCDVISLESYDYFMEDFELISMAEHKTTILDLFNMVRGRISREARKLDRFRTYGTIQKAGWHKGMEILSETIAKRVNIKSTFCIQVEEYEFSHMVISMDEVNECEQGKFLTTAIQHMTNFNLTTSGALKNISSSDLHKDWNGSGEYFTATNGIGCSLAAYKTFTSTCSPNMHLHCVFNRQNVTNINELGLSCQKCYKKTGCDSVFAYICASQETILKHL